MSQQNNNSAGMGLAVVATVLGLLALAFALVAAFITFVLTIICALVWESGKPFRCGSLHITPDEARLFIVRGLAGAFLVPAFALFCVVVTATPIRDDAWLYLVLGGYIIGSLGMEWLDSQGEESPALPQVEIVPPPAQLPPPAAEASREGRVTYRRYDSPEPRCPAVEKFDPTLNPKREFRFASWDDEEEFR